jgi:hypothetical protein
MASPATVPGDSLLGDCQRGGGIPGDRLLACHGAAARGATTPASFASVRRDGELLQARSRQAFFLFFLFMILDAKVVYKTFYLFFQNSLFFVF